MQAGGNKRRRGEFEPVDATAPRPAHRGNASEQLEVRRLCVSNVLRLCECMNLSVARIMGMLEFCV